MRARVVMATMVLEVALAACASDTTTTSTPAGTTSGPPSSAPPTSESATPSEEPVADVVLSDFFFAPDQITVTAGDTLTLFNSSTASAHTFTVTGQPIDVVVETQTAGEVTIDLEEGTYDLICKFHAGTANMVGTLVVEPAAA